MAYVVSSPIHSREHVESVETLVRSVVRRRGGGRIPLIIHATGGTTPSALEIAAGARGAVLVGFGERNSLASALHTKAELEALGIPAVVFHCQSVADCRDVLSRAAKVADAAESLLGVRAVLVGKSTRQVEEARGRFGWEVSVVSIDEFASMAEAAEPDAETLATFGDVRVAKIATALRRLGGDLVAIQCFPYLMKYRVTPCLALALLNAKGSTVACEGDLAAGFAMLLSRSLSGYSGWIANVVYTKGRRAAFAHCTISLDMVKNWRVMPHFESGLPHGLSGELAHEVYTIVSVSPRLDKIAVGRAKLVESGNFMAEACRTQAVVEFGDEARLEETAPANHHVFIPGDYVDEVEKVAKLLSMAVVKYPTS